MQDICILCGKEVERGGYSSKIGELVLRPLCSSCDELCSLDSKRVVEEHRELFEKMFAERRESLERRLSPVEPTITSAVPSRSQRERGLVKRYDDAYLVAKGTVVIGKTIRIVGIVFAVLVALGAFFSMTELKGDSAIGLLVVGIGVGGIVGMFCYAFGTLVAVQGQMLQASLDCAVNSSPFLNNDLRAEVMSI
jgi:hypothetical protein